jgi:hypothetical protein
VNSFCNGNKFRSVSRIRYIDIKDFRRECRISKGAFHWLKREFARIMIASAWLDVRVSDAEGKSSMEPSPQSDCELTWALVDKKTANAASRASG